MRTLFFFAISLSIGYMLALDGDFATRLSILQADAQAAAGQAWDMIDQWRSGSRERLVSDL